MCTDDRSGTPLHYPASFFLSSSQALVAVSPNLTLNRQPTVLRIHALPMTSITCAPPSMHMSLPPTSSVYLLLRILARLHSTSSSTNIVPLSCLKTRWAKPSSLLTSSTFRRPLVFVCLCYHSSTSYPLTPPWQASKHSLNP